MDVTQKAFIDGKWVDAISGEKFDVKNPTNNNVIASIPDMNAEDTQKAIDAASKAFSSWKNRSPKERSAIVRKWYNLLLKNKERIAKIVSAETGKPYQEAFGEAMFGSDAVDWGASLIQLDNGEIISDSNSKITHTKYPIGVVGLITPWNFPYAMVTRKAAFAISAGCTCIIKPAEDTPLSALVTVEIAHEAGIPPGVINVVTSNRKNAPAIGKLLCESTKVAGISFTGSTVVGKILYSQCASTVKRFCLELGGMAPFIVFPSANLSKAIEGAVGAKFMNCGQACIAASRFLIHEDIYDKFIKTFTDVVKNKLIVGENIGPLINDVQFKRVCDFVKDAVDKGAEVVYGGKPLTELGDKFYQPTILCKISENMRVYKEEVFGPVCSFIKFKTEEEALRIANDTRYGLGAYVYTEDISQMSRVAQNLEVGLVGLNRHHFASAEMAFGGVKESGIGKEGGKHCLDEFTYIQATVASNA